MSTLETGPAPAPIVISAQPGRRSGSATGSRRENDQLLWALLALMALAPLPLASNRPFFWALTAFTLGVIGLFYVGASLRAGRSLRVPLRAVAIPAALYLVTCGYLAVQALPLGIAPPIFIPNAPDVALYLPTISIAPGDTWLMLLRQLTYGAFGLLMLQVAARGNRRATLYRFLLAVICAYAVWGLVSLRLGDTILGLPKWAYQGSATSTFVNRNSFATFLAFGVCLATAALARGLVTDRRESGHHQRIDTADMALQLAALAILLATIMATQSRMGLFVAVAGALTIAVVASLRAGGGAKVAILLLLAAAGLGWAAYTFGSGMFERLGALDQATVVRYDFYVQIVELIRTRPLLGFGGGAFEPAYALIHQLPVNREVVWDRGHNTYLTLWAELGLMVGTLPILALLAVFAGIVVALVRRRGDWYAQAIALGVLVVGGLHSLVDFSLEIQANTLVFIALSACGISAGLRRNTSPDKG